MTDEPNTNAGAGPVEHTVRPGAGAPTLVERLRTDVLWHQRRGNDTIARDCQEAADEIDRLNELRRELQAERETLLERLARSGVKARSEERARIAKLIREHTGLSLETLEYLGLRA